MRIEVFSDGDLRVGGGWGSWCGVTQRRGQLVRGGAAVAGRVRRGLAGRSGSAVLWVRDKVGCGVGDGGEVGVR